MNHKIQTLLDDMEASRNRFIDNVDVNDLSDKDKRYFIWASMVMKRFSENMRSYYND